MEIYITRLQQILSFSRRCRRIEMENFFRQPIMVAYNFIISSPPEFSSFLRAW